MVRVQIWKCLDRNKKCKTPLPTKCALGTTEIQINVKHSFIFLNQLGKTNPKTINFEQASQASSFNAWLFKKANIPPSLHLLFLRNQFFFWAGGACGSSREESSWCDVSLAFSSSSCCNGPPASSSSACCDGPPASSSGSKEPMISRGLLDALPPIRLCIMPKQGHDAVVASPPSV